MMWLVYLLIAFIAIVLLKDFLSVAKYYARYKSQGIPLKFIPIVGHLKLFITATRKTAWLTSGPCSPK